jgi:energy-coupling factor transporter transmembrane protein EcfT
MYHLGQYIPGGSIIHRMDPRVKILSVIFLSIIILEGKVLTDAMIAALLIGLVPISRLTPHHMLKALRPLIVFLLLLFLLHLLFTGGTPIPPFPPWGVAPTYEGLSRGALVTLKFVLLVLAASILTMTTSPTLMVNGLERLLRPLRIIGVPSYDIATMISIALRFVPTLLEEMTRVREAQVARGADFRKGPLLRRIKSATSLLVPILMSSLRRADELASAMEGRGYRRGPRTYMQDLCMTRADYAALAVILVITLFWILQRSLPVC